MASLMPLQRNISPHKVNQMFDYTVIYLCTKIQYKFIHGQHNFFWSVKTYLSRQKYPTEIEKTNFYLSIKLKVLGESVKTKSGVF